MLLARVPSEGLSLSRVALFGTLLMLLAVSMVLAITLPARLDSLARPSMILGAAAATLALALSLFLLRYLDPERLLPVYARLGPLLWYLFAVSAQLSLYLLYLRNGLRPEHLATHRSLGRASLLIFGALIAVFCFVALTRLGITPDPAYWGEPGVPIMGWQFVLALLTGTVVFCVLLFRPASRLRVVLPLAVWGFAAAIWLSVPMDVLKNSFYVQIDPPAHTPFPYSDAGYYDSMAHSLLIGRPYQGEVPTRPLYIVFLAVLHILFGENYPHIIAAQTLVLALIPALLYSLASRLHSPPAGATVALFAIFRELTALWISSETRVSNTRTLLVDLPTLLFLLTACHFALRWLERRDVRSAFLAGGTFGLFVLLRTQSVLVLPFLFGVAALSYRLRWRKWLPAAAIFLLGTGVTVAPWLLHNYLRLGQVTFDAPFQYRVLASQYAYSGNLDIENYDFEGKSLVRVLIDFTLTDPGFVFGFIGNHFLAAEVDGLLALPLLEPYNGIFKPINLYWLSWNGQLAWPNILLLIAYLGVISIGIASAWRRWRWPGLMPLAFNIGYALATAVGRFSGWRYDLPADWVPYFYFGIGFVELLSTVALLFGANSAELNAQRAENHSSEEPLGPETNLARPALQYLLTPALCFFLIGALPWIAELPAAPRYTRTLDELVMQTADHEADTGRFLAENDDAVIIEGRLLYPRFFSRGNGLASASPWPAFAAREYPRLGFVVLNEALTHVVFPNREIPDIRYHGEDVVVVGCQRDGYVEARLIVLPGQGAWLAYAEPVSDPPLGDCAP